MYIGGRERSLVYAEYKLFVFFVPFIFGKKRGRSNLQPEWL